MSASDVYQLLDELEQLAAYGKRVPFSQMIMVDEEKLYSVLDRLRTRMPAAINEAEQLVQRRDQVLKEAQTEAENMLQETQSYLDEMAQESEISKRAEEQARERIRQAEETSREIRLAAHEYADDVLDQLGKILREHLAMVDDDRQQLGPAKNGPAQQEQVREDQGAPAAAAADRPAGQSQAPISGNIKRTVFPPGDERSTD